MWADRLRRQYVMLTADGVRAAVQATLGALLLSGHAHVWEVGVGAALYGAAASFFGPASTALIPETVPAERPQQANSLLPPGRSWPAWSCSAGRRGGRLSSGTCCCSR